MIIDGALRNQIKLKISDRNKIPFSESSAFSVRKKGKPAVKPPMSWMDKSLNHSFKVGNSSSSLPSRDLTRRWQNVKHFLEFKILEKDY